MFTILSKRYSEDVRVLAFIHAMRATSPEPATVVLPALAGRTDTAAFPRIILAGTPL